MTYETEVVNATICVECSEGRHETCTPCPRPDDKWDDCRCLHDPDLPRAKEMIERAMQDLTSPDALLHLHGAIAVLRRKWIPPYRPRLQILTNKEGT